MRAADIITPPEVEIVNGDHLIATLEHDGRLFMEMTVKRGRGYVPADRNKDPDRSIGVIPVDSIFTPIRKVNFQVENTRVGKITDYDRLTLEIWTNGTVAPDEAASQAARILTDHLALFLGLTDQSRGAGADAAKEDDERAKLLEMSIDELDLSVRSYNCLKRAASTPSGSWWRRRRRT